MIKRSGVWFFSAAVLFIHSISAATGAADRAPDLTGRWSGYFDSASSRGAVSMQVLWQNGRRFGADVCFASDPCMPANGTIAESGEMTITGRGAMVIHGHPFERSTALFVAEYHLMNLTGSSDQGNVVIVHHGSRAVPPAGIAGDWGGQATPEGTAAARPVATILEADDTGAITGRMGWTTAEARSQIAGQAVRAGDADEIAIVGLLDDSILAATLAPSAPQRETHRLTGTYQLLSSVRSSPARETGSIYFIFGKFNAAARQSEARANLKAMFTAEKAYFQEKDVYSTYSSVVGFSPERGNRYRYVLTANPISLEARFGLYPVVSVTDQGVEFDAFKYPFLNYSTITASPCAGGLVWGLSQINKAPEFTGAAYGDVDGDGTLDVWTVSTASRTLSGSNCDALGNVASGEPANEINDVNH